MPVSLGGHSIEKKILIRCELQGPFPKRAVSREHAPHIPERSGKVPCGAMELWHYGTKVL